MYMRLAIFIVLLGLYFHEKTPLYAQQDESKVVIELSALDFTIERPFTISVIIRDSENRPTIAFPDIPGFVKQSTSNSSTNSEVGGREVVNQVVTQSYVATRPGTFRLAPFSIAAGGTTIRSPGARLVVRPSATSAAAANAAILSKAKADKQAAFLRTTVSQTSLYTGEGLHIGVSFWVLEDYPYELRFDRLAEQVEVMARQLRPVNAWEENDNISELNRRLIVYSGRRYVEYPLYSATFFPLAGRGGAARTISLPAVSLRMPRLSRVVAGSPVSQTVPGAGDTYRQADVVTFVSQPIVVSVKPLPVVRGPVGPVSVGTFRLVDEVDRNRVAEGQSVRYDIRIEGQGNIASIQAPQWVAGPEVDVFPPQAQEQIGRTDGLVSGYKSFRYFLIPKQKGPLSLANRFFWVYFDPQSGRYDTLRPRTVLRVGEAADSLSTGIVPSDTLDQAGRPSIYAGLEQADSTEQSVNWPVLIRAIANVLILIMILGTLFVFARK
jgi:hypothetical protein